MNTLAKLTFFYAVVYALDTMQYLMHCHPAKHQKTYEYNVVTLIIDH